MAVSAKGDVEEVLYIPAPPRWSRGALVKELQLRLPPKVEQAFLFGSHARETANADSDIDLMVVMPTVARMIARPFELIDSFQGLGAIDLIVYTPEEWGVLEAEPQQPFFDPIETDWVRIR